MNLDLRWFGSLMALIVGPVDHLLKDVDQHFSAAVPRFVASYWLLAVVIFVVCALWQRLLEGADGLSHRLLRPRRLRSLNGIVLRHELLYVFGRVCWRLNPRVLLYRYPNENRLADAKARGLLSLSRFVRGLIAAMLTLTLPNVLIWLLLLHHAYPRWFELEEFGRLDLRDAFQTVVNADLAHLVSQAGLILFAFTVATGSTLRARAKKDQDLNGNAFELQARLMAGLSALRSPSRRTSPASTTISETPRLLPGYCRNSASMAD